jgi:ribosomal protein S18 acetylase RimI-like enzyme
MDEEDLPQVIGVENRWSFLSKWGEDGYRAVMRDPWIYTCLVAEDVDPARSQSAVIAGLAVLAQLIDHCELCNLVVAPEYLSKRVGYQLLEQCMKAAACFGIPRMLLEVRQSNQRAIDFYKRNGFQIIAQRQDYYLNPKENAWVMERLLQVQRPSGFNSGNV